MNGAVMIFLYNGDIIYHSKTGEQSQHLPQKKREKADRYFSGLCPVLHASCLNYSTEYAEVRSS